MSKIFEIQGKKILKSHIGAYWKDDMGNFERTILAVLVDGEEMTFVFNNSYYRDEEYKRLERELL